MTLKIGLYTVPTLYAFPVTDIARWAEDTGFESLWFGEHSHMPAVPGGLLGNGEPINTEYKSFFDPFVGLTAAAAVTKTIKLGTSVCLLPEHHPLTLAKTLSCLDVVSNGRVILGIGTGWNAQEIANHGIAFTDRWKLARESVMAMREIWTKEEPEFHGQFFDFGPAWSYPKPVQAGGPPVLMGTATKWAPKRIVDYCQGWLAADVGPRALGKRMDALKEEAQAAGRSMEEFDLTAMLFFKQDDDDRMEARIRELAEIGFRRMILMVSPTEPGEKWDFLHRAAGMMRRFG